MPLSLEMAPESIAARVARVRLFHKSPLNAYLRVNKSIWPYLSPRLLALPSLRAYSAFLHRLVRLMRPRHNYFNTFFLRNRPQLMLIRQLVNRIPLNDALRIAFVGCSNGAEVYSILWAIRSVHPDLNVIAHGVDISRDVLAVAESGVYSLSRSELVEERIFARVTEQELQELCDIDRDHDEARIKPWLKQGIRWHLADAVSSPLLDILGPQDLLVANNCLFHMDPPIAERCLRNIARLVAPGGHILISGVDLDVRTKVALDLGWTPLPELMEAIHDGDHSVRKDWPWEYWSLEPFNKRRRDWWLRYASAFQVGSTASTGGDPS